jgi:hypothetical protein
MQNKEAGCAVSRLKPPPMWLFAVIAVVGNVLIVLRAYGVL